MNKTQELCIGMFVSSTDKDLPIKGKIQSFTEDGQAIVKNYLDDEEYIANINRLQVINCFYSAKVFTIGNGEQIVGEYPTEYQIWEDINDIIRLSKEYPANTPLVVVLYIRQEYQPPSFTAEYIFEQDSEQAWVDYEYEDYLMHVDSDHSDILEERLNAVYLDWLKEFGYLPDCGETIETTVYHIINNTPVYSHTINHIRQSQETT